MAMNKKEIELMENLKEGLLIAKAFRFTDKVITDVFADDWRELTIGWSMNSYTKRVEQSCSTTNFHARGRIDKTTTQGSLAMYSSELLALQAMRNELEERFSKELAEVDKKIEALKTK